jgi:hypothetical protein
MIKGPQDKDVYKMTDNSAVLKFIDFVNVILTRPAMFNVNNIEDLELIILGYSYGVSSNDPSNEDLNRATDDFRRFVNTEFDSPSDTGWARIIRFYSGGDKHSLELFKIKFDKFWGLYQNSIHGQE